MALTSLLVPGQYSVLCTGEQIRTQPAYEYENGKPTKEQKRDERGNKLFSLRGALPLVEGEVVPDGSVRLVQEIKSATVEPGQMFGVEQGVFKVRAADKFGLTGTLTGTRLTKLGGGEK